MAGESVLSRLANPAPSASKSNAAGVKASRFHPLGFGIGAGVDTFMNLQEGDNLGTAVVKGAVTGMLWHTMPGIMTAHLAATTVPSVASAVNTWKRNQESWWNNQHRPQFGGNYQDTQRALTMRQAAVQKIQGSKLNARSALGGEARILSQSMYRS